MDEPPHTEGYTRVWNEIVAAVKNRRHGFHAFTLATVDRHGHPEARTMVLRGAEPTHRNIRFHCDARSPKMSEMRESPRACAVFYGIAEKLQVRAYGTVTIHHGDPTTEEAWSKMQSMSRDVYRTPFAPGNQRTEADRERLVLSLTDAYHNLAVCMLTVSAMEWLSLSSEGHERVRCEWGPDGTLSTRWLHP